MDKSKLGAIAILVVLGAGLFFSKSKDAPSPAEGGEEETTQPTRKPGEDFAGGVTKLKVEDLRPGKGPAAKAGDQLSMNYKGTLINGEVFDQSYGRSPFEFQLGARQVIKGWDEGIKGMKVGGKRKLTIPSDMGYGPTGSGKIPGGATLIFEVELLGINKK